MARRVSKVCYRLNMWYPSSFCSGFPGGSVVKNPPITAGDTGDVCLISGSGRSPEGRNGNPLQYSCQDNPMDRGAWWAIHFMGLQRAGHDWGIKGENAVISSTGAENNLETCYFSSPQHFWHPGLVSLEDNFFRDGRWEAHVSGRKGSNGEQKMKLVCSPAAHLLLWGPVPNRLWTSTVLQSRCWGPLSYMICCLISSLLTFFQI